MLQTDETGRPAPAVEVHGLVRRFGAFMAVDGLDLTIPAGTIFGLLGPNGAGKSTTIKMLTTMLPPSAGSARVAGYDVVRQAVEVRRHIGYVPQLLSADGALTGRENLDLFAKLYGIPRAERAARIGDALALMGLGDFADTLASHYSGGMVRRLEIAQSMLHHPAVLFLDEPTVGLDPVARRTVWERLRELRARDGTTILLTTHDMEEAAELCDRVAIMHAGRLVALGTPAELEAEVGAGATLDDVFVHFSGATLDTKEDFVNVRRTRRTAGRLG
ncbi:MAG TPA: ATP-binding cassette domain-containing protein [Oscillatoriaceae cyanobacterium]